MTTTTMSTIEAKEDFSELVNRVSQNKERIILTRRGKEIAALIPIDDLEYVQHAQNKNDFEDAVEALQEARSEGVITLDDLKETVG